MTPTTGYYCLIQYCPDPSRLEAANVGVLLFAPAIPFLKALTSRHNRRARRFFGHENQDWVHINSFKRGMQERVAIEGPAIRGLSDLERFIGKQANELRITEPRPMLVADPDRELQQLFSELVDGQHQKRPSFKSFLGKRLSQAGLDQMVRRDISVRVPTFDREVVIPFGYQNGRFRLIRPATFEAEDPDRVEATACRYAIEGESLFENSDRVLGDLQLVVVGRFPKKKSRSRETVRRILEGHKVELVASNEIDKLIEDIRTNGKVLPTTD